MAEEIPRTMRAIGIETPGGPDVLKMITQDVPVPGEYEVLIRVVAAGVNRPDCLQRRGLYAPPSDASPLPGLEVSGIVAAAGSGVSRLRTGESVMALCHGGGYAEFCCVNEGHCLPVPDSLTFVEAAAFPETYFTVWYNVFMRCALSAGETFLVHGGSSGIGTTAIQLAKARGCTVITTAGSAAKCQFCEDLGADISINYKSTDWARAVADAVGDNSVDVLLDMVAGPYMQQNLNLLARDGRCAIIAFLGGTKAELDMRVITAKRLTITGSTLRAQSIDEKTRIADGLAQNVVPLLETDEVKPIIHATFPLSKAASAHEMMESSQHMGKIVLKVSDAV